MYRMKRAAQGWMAMVVVLSSIVFLGMECPMGDGNNNNNSNGNGNSNNNSNGNTNDGLEIDLVKLSTQATTTSGPKVGDGIIVFNAQGNAILAWLNAGETSTDVKEVPAPSGLTHDTSLFTAQGKKIVVKDRNSGAIYVYDTQTDDADAIPTASVNITTGTFSGDGKYVASINSTVTTQDGAHLLIKVTDISDNNSFVTTSFTDPNETPNAISVDATSKRIAVRGTDSFFIYDIDTPGAATQAWTISELQGGVGFNSDMKIRGDYIAFFDDNDNFSLLNILTGVRSQPARNPGRANTGLDIESDVFGYFAAQTTDDGSTISVINRALFGDVSNINSLVDPAGTQLNGEDDLDGRIGFGASISISPDGKYVCVAGASPVGVAKHERLYISVDGGNFKPVLDPADPTGFLAAAAVSVNNNLIAFLITADPTIDTTNVSVGYAELP